MWLFFICQESNELPARWLLLMAIIRWFDFLWK